MDESTIRQNAQLYAMVAEMHAIVARVEGMRAENIFRVHRGETIAYPGEHFFEAEDALEKIAERMRKEI